MPWESWILKFLCSEYHLVFSRCIKGYCVGQGDGLCYWMDGSLFDRELRVVEVTLGSFDDRGERALS